MIINSQEIEERAVERIADLMCVAARTAPKAKGVDNLVTLIVNGQDKEQLSAEMRRIAQESGMDFFQRDANCIDKAALVVLLGQKVKPMGVKPCGFCGYADCSECAQGTGRCAISIGDLGIALGSAVDAAASYHADNRVMFSIGKAAVNLGLLGAEVNVAYGIPLSITGKSPFFDR
ncbi:ferredoxin domain-containing protein [Pelosinus sp. sgz500959]|uniref:ferredoxin domain-containing protein n=1 Tax=Pelosinus sp. sgz500959 TaxID=3242472 RepID=UPI00366D92CA